MEDLPNELLITIAAYANSLEIRGINKRMFSVMNEIFYSDVRNIMKQFREDLRIDNQLSRNLRNNLNCARDAIQETNSLCIKWRILRYIYDRRDKNYELEYDFKITHEISDLLKIMRKCKNKERRLKRTSQFI